ncbi:class I SAM-dependent methyltransferase [Halobaculum litoreum]|uniref:Class I SAM-dependent methyltransferase n=1 Tax=Halobaculum litoreum TaxID=3031998 RepID=A0ABD5Y0E5_9EURY
MAGGSYDSAAFLDRYSRLRERGLFEREAAAAEEHFPAGGRVLDLGCGAGRTTRPLVERGFGVVAVDLSEAMVERARAAGTGASLATADAASLPFVDDAFDAVLFSYNGIDELRPASARRRALAEVARVLAPGGRFAFSTRNKLRWLLPVPPSPTVVSRFLRFWALNGLAGTVATRYRHDPTTNSPKRVHYTDPLTQRREPGGRPRTGGLTRSVRAAVVAVRPGAVRRLRGHARVRSNGG